MPSFARGGERLSASTVPPLALAVAALTLALTQPTPAGGPTPLAGGFNYQFQLRQNGQPYNGTCDFEFRLYDGPHGTGATQIGPTVPATQTITDGTSLVEGLLKRTTQ